MGLSLISITLLLALPIPAGPPPQSPLPMLNSVEPASAKAGEVVTASGVNLGQDIVAALYLTDGKNDLKLAIVEQTEQQIRFRIPAEAKAGRFALMVLTKGADARLIEEPVKITIEGET